MVEERIIRAALYERVSTEEQKLKGFSIETQKYNPEQYCRDHRMKIVGHYTDEGISGAKPPLKRPNLKRLLDDIELGKIDIILFTKLDRWFRSVKEYFKVQEILDKYKVGWTAIHESYDTTTANGQMAITIFMAVAQNERDRTAERIVAVLDHKRRNKEACFGGRVPPFGYRKERDENGIMRLVKDPETEQAASDFWNIIIETGNLNKAIRHMNNVYGIVKDWKSWKRMTQKDFYCGQHKGVENFCEPYISYEDFIRIQGDRALTHISSGRIYIFKGLLICPECGSKLCGDATVRKDHVWKSYRCPKRSRECTHSKSYAERQIEKQLLSELNAFLGDTIAKVQIEAAKPKRSNLANINKLKETRRRLEVVYMAGNKTDEEYLSEDLELKRLIELAESEQIKEPPNIKPLQELLTTDYKALYELFTDEEKQEFWFNLIRKIEFGEEKKIKRVCFFDR